jgi:peptide/nickel transport system permease protein
MLVYILRRLSQTGLVLLLTSMLVFAGLFLIGDPIEILVSPEADQVERDRARAGAGAARVPAGFSPDAFGSPRAGADRPAV